MKETNVLSQLSLVESINKGRQSQIDAISVAVASFQPEENSRHSKIYAYLSVYLSFFAQWLEKEIAYGMMELGELKELPNYPGEGQVDFRLCHSLGVLEGLNQLGILSSALIGHSQSALTKAALFAMAKNKKANLPLFSTSLNDELYLDIHACSRAISEQHILCKSSLALAITYQHQCEDQDFRSEMALAPICATSCDKMVAETLKRMAQMANQPFCEPRMFDHDPAGHVCGVDVSTSRAMAAGIVSGVITSYIKTKLPWSMLNNN